jgi:hypothetical protein
MTDIACTVSSVASGKYSSFVMLLFIVQERILYVWLLLFSGGRCFMRECFEQSKEKPQKLLQTYQRV